MRKARLRSPEAGEEDEMRVDGSCHCGAIRFSVSSVAPYPYRICHCQRCRKLDGGLGGAVNIIAEAVTLTLDGDIGPSRYESGITVTSFCPSCGTALFLDSPLWPEWIYPFASAIDTALPTPPHYVHIYAAEGVAWAPMTGTPEDPTFDANTDESIIGWHERLGLLVSIGDGAKPDGSDD
jgi:hypothetical protein